MKIWNEIWDYIKMIIIVVVVVLIVVVHVAVVEIHVPRVVRRIVVVLRTRPIIVISFVFTRSPLPVDNPFSF